MALWVHLVTASTKRPAPRTRSGPGTYERREIYRLIDTRLFISEGDVDTEFDEPRVQHAGGDVKAGPQPRGDPKHVARVKDVEEIDLRLDGAAAGPEHAA